MVDAKPTCWLPGLPLAGLARQCALLAGVTLAAGAIVGAIAYGAVGRDGIAAAAVAGLLCLAGAESALMFTQLGRQHTSRGALTGMLLGMCCRFGIPLLGSLAIRLAAPRLFAAGALYCLIALYLVTLTVEIGLELCNVSLPRYRGGRS
jgi:hypothetical protein